MSESDANPTENGVKRVHYDFIEEQFRILAGKVLTIIDASIPDQRQNKCLKDIIRAEFYRRIDDVQCFYWPDGKNVNTRVFLGVDDVNPPTTPLN